LKEMIAPQGSLRPFSLEDMKNPSRPTMCLRKQRLNLPREQQCSTRNKCDWNFKWLELFHMNYSWNAFTYKVVIFFETFSMIVTSIYNRNMRWLWLQKKFKTCMLFGGTWALTWGNLIAPWGTSPTPNESVFFYKELHLFLKEFFCSSKNYSLVPLGTWLPLGKNHVILINQGNKLHQRVTMSLNLNLKS
jgi:hypothetical protein